MKAKLLKGAKVFNEGKSFVADVLIRNERIEKIASEITATPEMEVMNLDGKWLLPGCIDDQVHFREPGLTHKGNIQSESRAAVAGGITSFMEMPNTVPNALTQTLLQDKYDIASRNSPANYSFFMGASNDNIEEVLKTDGKNVCGIKIFMGSSTGNMLVDQEETLNALFSQVPLLIATHCEDEATIRQNTALYREKYGENVPMEMHPLIRSAEACYISSSMAVSLAKKYNTRLHILHISTAGEVELFRNDVPLAQKRITSEACVHHLWFTDEDYASKGAFIKWNPAVKTAMDREGIWAGLLNDKIDIIATDHAPHTMEEKNGTYFNAPSGGPLVQHALLAMLEKAKEGVLSVEKVVEKMAHAPAICFQLEERGFVREGYYADLVIVDPSKKLEVQKSNILYSCGWSPFEGTTFSHQVAGTFVNGNLVYDGEKVRTDLFGKRLTFQQMKLTCISILILTLLACQTEIRRIPAPKNLIPRDTMVLLLQDLTVLESHITNDYPQVNKYQKLMRNSGDALLEEYHVTFERFNKSLDYYGSRQDEMQSIYSEVQDSLTFKMNRLQ